MLRSRTPVPGATAPRARLIRQHTAVPKCGASCLVATLRLKWTPAFDSVPDQRRGVSGVASGMMAWGTLSFVRLGRRTQRAAGIALGKSHGRSHTGHGGNGKGRGGGGGGTGRKPTDDPEFVRWHKGMHWRGSRKGLDYVVDAYVASGTFSRVFRVHAVAANDMQGGLKRRGAESSQSVQDGVEAIGARVFAAKVMRKNDTYIQYTSDAQKEGTLLQKVERAQAAAGKDVLTMCCYDSFATTDDAGREYWCLILEWLGASLFDVVRANRNRGLHLSMVRVMLAQLLEQLKVLREYDCTHTDIKHKNCCLAGTEHFFAPAGVGGSPTLILTRPLAKLIDYGNAVFEGEKKVYPIHTKQFRAPEVLLNLAEDWGPPSDMWTLGVTAAYLVTGRLLFNSHDPGMLVRAMVGAVGPFHPDMLESAKNSRMRRVAKDAAAQGVNAESQLGVLLGLAAAAPGTPEADCADLLQRMLAPHPAERIGPEAALRHPFIVAAEPEVPEMPSDALLAVVELSGSFDARAGKAKGRGKRNGAG